MTGGTNGKMPLDGQDGGMKCSIRTSLTPKLNEPRDMHLHDLPCPGDALENVGETGSGCWN